MKRNKRLLYWLFQVFGWGFVLSLSAITLYQKGELSTNNTYNHIFLFLVGIGVSHLYRFTIIKLDWLRHKPMLIVPRVLIGSLLFGLVYYAVHSAFVTGFLDKGEELTGRDWVEHILSVINLGIIFFLWSVIYFSAHFIEKSRKQEIQGLQMDALQSEMELSNLKSQLNPHFMFNAMNSIRALIDENPREAKNSVTLLSNILRNTLMMGKKEVITIQEEMSVVQDYLALERIRYEERLRITYDIDDALLKCTIPPLMIQTIVENAIKHGISKLPQGGELKISLRERDEEVTVCIENSGEFISSNGSETGIGLKNTRKRLYLLYGGAAKLNIENNQAMVRVTIILPKMFEYESISN